MTQYIILWWRGYLIGLIGCFLHILSDDGNKYYLPVIFGEHYFKDHIGNTVFDLISGLFAYVIFGKKKRPN